MKPPIFNANVLQVDHPAGELPQMGEVLDGMFQPMVFVRIAKSVVNFKLQEVRTSICFDGVWQPAGRQLVMTANGQRKWKTYSVWSTPNLELSPDDVIQYREQNYRVMAVDDYKIYGYVHYMLTEDYK